MPTLITEGMVSFRVQRHGGQSVARGLWLGLASLAGSHMRPALSVRAPSPGLALGIANPVEGRSTEVGWCALRIPFVPRGCDSVFSAVLAPWCARPRLCVLVFPHSQTLGVPPSDTKSHPSL